MSETKRRTWALGMRFLAMFATEVWGTLGGRAGSHLERSLLHKLSFGSCGQAESLMGPSPPCEMPDATEVPGTRMRPSLLFENAVQMGMNFKGPVVKIHIYIYKYRHR